MGARKLKDEANQPLTALSRFPFGVESHYTSAKAMGQTALGNEVLGACMQDLEQTRAQIDDPMEGTADT